MSFLQEKRILTHNWIFVGKNGVLICKLMAEDGKSEPVIICSSGPVISVREKMDYIK